MNREEFIKSVVRYGVLTGLLVLSGALFNKSRKNGGLNCEISTSCKLCKQSASCELDKSRRYGK